MWEVGRESSAFWLLGQSRSAPQASDSPAAWHGVADPSWEAVMLLQARAEVC